MMSMAATVIFWTADLRVTASTRIGAPPPSSWQIPAASCWQTRTAGRGAYAIDQRNGNARYLVAAHRWSGRIFRRDHTREPGARRSILRDFADPLVQKQKLRMVNR